MRQGAEQSAPTSFPYTITCMIMLIIISRIQLLYYSSLISFCFNDGTNLDKNFEILHRQNKKQGCDRSIPVHIDLISIFLTIRNL